MKKVVLLPVFLIMAQFIHAQNLDIGVESVFGVASTSFEADLASIVGFSELEISESDIDSAFATLDVSAPRWIKELFPGIRIEVDQPIKKKLNRVVRGVRFYARYRFIGASFTISDPYLTERLESRKLKNQIKAVNLSLKNDATGLAEHLAKMAIADANRVDPFFSSRYDLAAYVDVKRLVLGDDELLEWGDNGRLDASCLGGMRFTADPSAVVDLGSVLFIRDRIDSLMQGRLLDPVEDITDAVAEAVQNIVFGKFRDPRVVPSVGWFIRPTLLVDFGGSFAFQVGGEFSVHDHIAVKGTKPMVSFYGFTGLKWRVLGKQD